MSEQVCVTGASGYVGAHVVRELLARGCAVRGTVRDPDARDRVAHLRELPGAAERLELVRADLLEDGAFHEAVRGCTVVMHVASPYALTVDDPQRDLVDPAVNGTRNVLSACRDAGTVRRVVLTSSMAAVTDEPDGRVLTEDDWNTRSGLDRNPYYYSKALAERAAWDFVETEAPGFDLVVINPFLVIGPSLSASLNPSPRVLRDIVQGAYPGIVSLSWGFVDVRDVATAHVRAMEVPDASGRYLCAGEVASMREVAAMLRDAGHPAPRLPLDNPVGDAVVRLASRLQPAGVGTYLRTHVGRTIRYDNGKIRRELGVTFRPLAESVRDTLSDLVKWGHLGRPA